MGWWSTDILGGDTPLDIICSIENSLPETVEIDVNSEEEVDKIRKHLTDNKKIVFETVNKWEDEDGINLQVLAFILIRYGVPITKEERQLFIDACKSDTWAETNSNRQAHINNLIETINNYKDEPIMLTTTGLFEVIFNQS